MTNKNEIQMLEDFVLNNPELEQIEKMLTTFNIFETLKIERAEIRHSNMLAWLLNPNENHGIGESFVRQFLKYIVFENRASLPSTSLIEFETSSFSDLEIRREWNNIDLLLILNEQLKRYVVAIENKILSEEHSNQLQQYRQIIEDEFGKDSKPLLVFLTPEETSPSDEHWLTFSYSRIADLLDDLLKYNKETLSESIYTFILHYVAILRRYIVGKSEIEHICEQIYKKHQKALDLIFDYRPDIAFEVYEYLKTIIRNNPELILDIFSKSYIRFTSKTIDGMIDKCGEGWTSTKRILLYELQNSNKRLVLKLYIGLGPKEFRERLRDFCAANPSLFKLAGVKWLSVYQKEFLKATDYEDATIEDLKKKIDVKMDDFMKEDSKRIDIYFKDNWK